MIIPLWAAITPFTNLTLNARLTTEPRTWVNAASYIPFKGKTGTDWTYGEFDALNLQYRNFCGLPATLTVGRQDLMLGDGWLVLEGTPYDGSETLYLDAARLTYNLEDAHTTIDVMGILQSAKDDAWLPTINNQDRWLSEQNENGVILDIANKTIPAANLDGYFIYKHDSIPHDDAYKVFGDNADIFTLGGRVSGLVNDHWKYSAEGAYQFGRKQDLSIKFPAVSTDYHGLSAFGVNSKLSYLFKDSLNQQVCLSYEFLSGDDPKTKTDEMFDILWGRWPRWSEVYDIYSYFPETRVGQIANLHRIGPGYTITPLRNLDFSASYYILLADQDVATRNKSAPQFTGTGNFRGQYLQTVLKYKFNQHLSGHLWGELVFPGDFYTHTDMIPWFRAEMTMTF